MNCDVCHADVLAAPARTWQDLHVCTACYRALSRAVLIGVQPARMAVTCRDCEQVVSGDARACPYCECELENRSDGWPRVPQEALESLTETEAARLRETEEELIASSKPELAALLANSHSQQSFDDAYDRLRNELSQLRMARQATPIESTGAFSEDYERALICSSEAIVGFKLDFVTRYIWARWPGREEAEDSADSSEQPTVAAGSQPRGSFLAASRAALRRVGPWIAGGCLTLIVAVVAAWWIVKSHDDTPQSPPAPSAKQQDFRESEPAAPPSRRSLQEQQIKDLQAELARLQQEAAEAKAQAAQREPALAQATDEPRTIAFVLDQSDSMRKPLASGREMGGDSDGSQPFEAAKADVLDAISQLEASELFCIVAYGGDRLEQFPSIGVEPATAENKELAASFLRDLCLGEGTAGSADAHPYSAMVHALYRNPHEMFVHAGTFCTSPTGAMSSLELESLRLHNGNRNSAPIHFRTYGDERSASPAEWMSALLETTNGSHRHTLR